MRLCLILLDDVLYLPGPLERFFDRFREDIALTVLLPPARPSENAATLASRLLRMYGAAAFARTAAVVLARKVLCAAGLRKSLSSLARRRGIPVIRARDVNAPSVREKIKEAGATLGISLASPQIFSPALLAAFPEGCLNFHGGYIPDYRGVFSAFWVLHDGAPEAGVTLHYMTPQVDAGPMIAREKIKVEPGESVDSLYRKIVSAGMGLLCEVVDVLKRGGRPPAIEDPRPGKYRTYPTAAERRAFIARGGRYF